MKTALISINTNLASSIALRYACDLSNKMDISLYDIHVVETKQSGRSPGFGWVQKTWENALIETKREDIRQFLEMEKVFLPFLKTPKILIGDRTEKLLDELQTERYTFFLEGVLPSFNPHDFYKLIHSRLYRFMPCPALIVKNLVPLEKVALLLDKDSDPREFIPHFLEIFGSAGFGIDLFDLNFTKSGDLLVENEEESQNTGLTNVVSIFAKNNISPNTGKTITGRPKKIADHLRPYGLVIACIQHKSKKNNPLIELLGHVASPVFVFWR